MGGAEAARWILEYDRSARLVVASGYSEDAVLADHRSHGFCAAVSKPYSADELLVALDEALRDA